MDVFELLDQQRIHRFFRATRKLNVPNLISHITQRAAGRGPLCLEDNDYLFLLRLLKDVSRNYSVKPYAFCFMPNHVHLLLRATQANLWEAMRDLFSRYAVGFNRKYERKGHLFSGPYRQAVCLDDSYLLAASLYIHLNPVEAGLVESPVQYRWSSCRLYVEEGAPEAFVDPNFVLSLLEDDSDQGRRTYQDLLNQGRGTVTAEVFEQEDAVERFRISLAFKRASLFKWLARTHRVAESSGVHMPTIEDLERDIEKVKMDRHSRKPETRRAKRYLIEQLIARGYQRAEIAQKLGISRKTLYNILNS